MTVLACARLRRETSAKVRHLLLSGLAGEMSRSDRGGQAPLDQIVRRYRNGDVRPPSAFGISPRRTGGEFCQGPAGGDSLGSATDSCEQTPAYAGEPR